MGRKRKSANSPAGFSQNIYGLVPITLNIFQSSVKYISRRPLLCLGVGGVGGGICTAVVAYLIEKYADRKISLLLDYLVDPIPVPPASEVDGVLLQLLLMAQ